MLRSCSEAPAELIRRCESGRKPWGAISTCPLSAASGETWQEVALMKPAEQGCSPRLLNFTRQKQRLSAIKLFLNVSCKKKKKKRTLKMMKVRGTARYTWPATSFQRGGSYSLAQTRSVRGFSAAPLRSNVIVSSTVLTG